MFIFSEGFSKLGLTDRIFKNAIFLSQYKNEAYKHAAVVLRSKEDLTTLCTMIIFTSSVRHAALNFLQWEYGSFAPVNPYCMRGNLPTENDRRKITQKFIMDSLPGPKHCIRAAGIAFTLTEFSEDEVFLLLKKDSKHGRKTKPTQDLSTFKRNRKRSLMPQGAVKYKITDSSRISKSIEDVSRMSPLLPPRWLFNEQEVKNAYARFQNQLHQIEEKIKERNSSLTIPYTVLLPSQIPVGIAI